MKIRIKGNSLRLRLSQSEIEKVKNEGIVSDSISFGESKLIYSLQSTDSEEIFASFNGEFINVSVPHDIANEWANTDLVSLENNQNLNERGELSILIEKDFQCLVPRNEDESDLFENPQAKEK